MLSFKPFILFFFICLFNFNYAQSPFQLKAVSPAIKSVDKNIYDLGEIPSGQEVQLDFEIINQSGEPVRIQSVTSSCNCQIVEENYDALAPESSTVLSIKYNTKQKQGTQLERIAIVFDNAPYQHLFYLKSNITNAKLVETQVIQTPETINVIKPGFNIEVFPNPTSEILNVSILKLEAEQLNIEMINALGQRVFSQQVRQADSFVINVKDFSEGLYYLFFTNSKGEIFKESVVVTHP